MQTITHKIFIILNIALMLFVAVFFSIQNVQAKEQSTGAKSITTGLNEAANLGFTGSKGSGGGLKEGNGIPVDLAKSIGGIIGVALSFIGFAFFVLMIYGGFIWMFSRGNSQDVEKAKDLITAAVIGLVIVLSAYAITMFIGDALTSGPDGGVTLFYKAGTPLC